MSKARRLVVALITASLVMAVAVPAASAQKRKSAPLTLRSLNKKLLSTSSTAKSARTRANAARRTATRLGNNLANLTSRVKTAEGVLASAPLLAAGLTQLSDVVQKQIAPGLQQLATAAQQLGDNYLADEFGFAQFVVPDNAGTDPDDADSAPDALPGCFYESPNIPDSVQETVVSGQCLVPLTVTGNTPLSLLTGIRSNEVDGTGPADPVGSARVISLVIQSSSGGIPQAGATTQRASDGAPVIDIPNRSPQTSTTETSFPFTLISTDNTIDLLASQFSTGSQPTVGPGSVILFTLGFYDLTPASPDPKQ